MKPSYLIQSKRRQYDLWHDEYRYSSLKNAKILYDMVKDDKDIRWRLIKETQEVLFHNDNPRS